MDESAPHPRSDATDPLLHDTPPLEAHELEDDGPEPVLDAATEEHVRSLLASEPSPGPMPEHLADRVVAALAEEARLRVEPGPLARVTALPGAASGPHDDVPTDDDADAAVLHPLLRQRHRPRPLLAAAAVAAAAAVVAVGGSALHLSTRSNGEAALGDASAVVTSPTPGASSGASSGATSTASVPTGGRSGLHIQLSRGRYDASNLTTRARALLAKPDAPVQVLAAESPLLGPIATPIGLSTCLAELGVPEEHVVHADLATYEGQPVAVVVATAPSGGDTVWVVRRSCTTGDAAVVRDATPVP